MKGRSYNTRPMKRVAAVCIALALLFGVGVAFLFVFAQEPVHELVLGYSDIQDVLSEDIDTDAFTFADYTFRVPAPTVVIKEGDEVLSEEAGEETTHTYRLHSELLPVVDSLRFPLDSTSIKSQVLETLENKELVRFFDTGEHGTGCDFCQALVVADPGTRQLLVVSLNSQNSSHTFHLSAADEFGRPIAGFQDAALLSREARLEEALSDEALNRLLLRADVEVELLETTERYAAIPDEETSEYQAVDQAPSSTVEEDTGDELMIEEEHPETGGGIADDEDDLVVSPFDHDQDDTGNGLTIEDGDSSFHQGDIIIQPAADRGAPFPFAILSPAGSPPLSTGGVKYVTLSSGATVPEEGGEREEPNPEDTGPETSHRAIVLESEQEEIPVGEDASTAGLAFATPGNGLALLEIQMAAADPEYDFAHAWDAGGLADILENRGNNKYMDPKHKDRLLTIYLHDQWRGNTDYTYDMAKLSRNYYNSSETRDVEGRNRISFNLTRDVKIIGDGGPMTEMEDHPGGRITITADDGYMVFLIALSDGGSAFGGDHTTRTLEFERVTIDGGSVMNPRRTGGGIVTYAYGGNFCSGLNLVGAEIENCSYTYGYHNAKYKNTPALYHKDQFSDKFAFGVGNKTLAGGTSVTPPWTAGGSAVMHLGGTVRYQNGGWTQLGGDAPDAGRYTHDSCVFKNNSCELDGGAVFLNGFVPDTSTRKFFMGATFRNCRFEGNKTKNTTSVLNSATPNGAYKVDGDEFGKGRNGGAVGIGGSAAWLNVGNGQTPAGAGLQERLEMRFEGCGFTGNMAEGSGQGGAIKLYGSTWAVIQDCEFTNNIAEARGGAVYAGAQGTESYSGFTPTNITNRLELTISGVTMGEAGDTARAKANTAATGGALYLSNTHLTLEGADALNILNNKATANATPNSGAGGGIAVKENTENTIGGIGTLTVFNSISDNIGGGMHINGGATLTLQDGVTVNITKNETKLGGGGISVGVGATLTTAETGSSVKLDISINVAVQSGGGVFLREKAKLTLNNGAAVSITGNTTKGSGGGVSIDSGAALTTGAEGYGGTLDISNNSALYNGGGLFLRSGATLATVNAGDQLTVHENSAGHRDPDPEKSIVGHGGGLYTEEGDNPKVQLYGSTTFTRNKAPEGDGGGMYLGQGTRFNMAGTVKLDFNTAISGGGIAVNAGNAKESLEVHIDGDIVEGLTNTLVVENNYVEHYKKESAYWTNVQRGGGLIFLSGRTQIWGPLDVEIKTNHAANGGGIYLAGELVSDTNDKDPVTMHIEGNVLDIIPEYDDKTETQDYNNGGGVFMADNAKLTLTSASVSRAEGGRNFRITGNKAIRGGGIYLTRSNTILLDGPAGTGYGTLLDIYGNRAEYGAGIYTQTNKPSDAHNTSVITVQNQSRLWIRNHTQGYRWEDSKEKISSIFHGGGIYVSANSTLQLDNRVNAPVTDRTHPDERAIEITGNHATYWGGGVLLNASAQSVGNLLIKSDKADSQGSIRIAGNTSGQHGAGVYVTATQGEPTERLVLIGGSGDGGTLVKDNIAQLDGGGIHVQMEFAGNVYTAPIFEISAYQTETQARQYSQVTLGSNVNFSGNQANRMYLNWDRSGPIKHPFLMWIKEDANYKGVDTTGGIIASTGPNGEHADNLMNNADINNRAAGWLEFRKLFQHPTDGIQPVVGAKFTLYHLECAALGTPGHIHETDDPVTTTCWKEMGVVGSDENGRVHFDGLMTKEAYRLVESEARQGLDYNGSSFNFIQLDSVWEVEATIGENATTKRISNHDTEPDIEPSTVEGGIPTLLNDFTAGYLEFTKLRRNSDDDKPPLSGAEFVLYHLECKTPGHDHSGDHPHHPPEAHAGCWVPVKAGEHNDGGDLVVSGSEGQVQFYGLVPGEDYRLVETKAPGGLRTPEGYWRVKPISGANATVELGSGTLHMAKDNDGKLTLINSDARGELTFYKMHKDPDRRRWPIEKAGFTLYRLECNHQNNTIRYDEHLKERPKEGMECWTKIETQYKTVVNGEDVYQHMFSFQNLVPDVEYRLVEDETPPGYDSAEISVWKPIITPGSNATVETIAGNLDIIQEQAEDENGNLLYVDENGNEGLTGPFPLMLLVLDNIHTQKGRLEFSKVYWENEADENGFHYVYLDNAEFALYRRTCGDSCDKPHDFVLKKDDEDNFIVTNDESPVDNPCWELVDTQISPLNQNVVFEKLIQGEHYRLVETKAPKYNEVGPLNNRRRADFITPINSVWEVLVKVGENATLMTARGNLNFIDDPDTSNPYQLLVNEEGTGYFEFIKMYRDPSRAGHQLGNATFALYLLDCGDARHDHEADNPADPGNANSTCWIKVGESTSDPVTGIVRFDSLASGETYRLVESQTPTGYYDFDGLSDPIMYDTMHEWPHRGAYVHVDGIYLRRNWGGEFENISILVAIAVNEDGYREVLGTAEGMKEFSVVYQPIV